MAPPILYGVKYSSPVTSILFIAEEIGLEIDYRQISLLNNDHRKPEFLKMNPQHTVPTLNDNDHILWDSHAIGTYLIDKHAKSDKLYPKDLYVRGRIDQRLHFDSGVISVVHQNCLKPIVYRGASDITEENRDAIWSVYDLLESFFRATNETYLVGNEMTIADVACGFSLGPLVIFDNVNATRWPMLRAWLNRMDGNDRFKRLNGVCLDELRKSLPKKYRQI